MRKLFPYIIFSAIIIGIILGSCANQGSIAGGPKDVTPPEIVLCEPENFSINISDTKIHIRFNEYIQLKNINENLILSPPLEEKPDIKARGKDLFIDLNNELLEKTTYTLNFGNAITDLNEGNILNNFLFVFSTGDEIDSLRFGGYVENVPEGVPVENALVMLYREYYDSIPYKQIPVYISRTGKNGNFTVNNIHEGNYKVFVLEETINNYLYDMPGEENIAFSDSLVSPYVKTEITTDTITPDSVVQTENTRYYPDDFKFYLFKEDIYDQYISGMDRPEREKCLFIFNESLNDSIIIRMLEQAEPEDWYYYESTPDADTVIYWIRDSLISNIDSLVFELEYDVRDKKGDYVAKKDTVVLSYRELPAGNPNDKNVKNLIIGSNIRIRGGMEPGKKIILNFSHPVVTLDSSKIHLYEVADSLENSLKMIFDEQLNYIASGDIFFRNMTIPYTTEEDKKYKLFLEPGAFHDIYNKTNDSININFQVNKEDYYGSVVLNISGVEAPGILQLIKGKNNVIRNIPVLEDGEFRINRLEPSGYLFRYIFDSNNNGKWDTGNYLQKIQPEKVKYFKQEEVKVKSNWEIKEDFILNN